MIGRQILHYRILEEIGRGGMGVVYKAEDTKLGRVVALKFLPEHGAKTDEERERFLQEARAASSLNHQNVCTIHGIEEFEGREFIEMELVEGTTLRDRIGGTALSTSDAIGFALQIGEALTEAHRQGIVHRDIKSENIMVAGKNQIKVMDFGLAKLKGSLKLTKTSSTVGTLAYMAPEQIQGGEVDARSDIFSFGVVVYEMLTGKLPFKGEHDASVMYSILNEDPVPLASASPRVDPELDRIIRRALEKDPEDRYQHVDDMVSELRRGKKQTGPVTRPAVTPATGPARAPKKSRYPLVIGGGGLAALILLVGSIWYFTSRPSAGLDSIAVLPFANTSGDPGTEYLAEGITENVINKLSQLSGLRVIPRSMVARYGGNNADPAAAGRELNVGAVLTGKVTQRDDALTIQVELIDVGHLSQLWGEQYNRTMSDVIAVQQEIARTVVEKLETRLTGAEQEHLKTAVTSNPEAYQAYIKGRFNWNKRTGDGNARALTYFREAVDLDPGFALAYVGIANCYSIGATLDMNTSEAIPMAKQALRQALTLDPDLAEAHAGLGITQAYNDFDFAAAEASFRKSIEVNPRFATVHHWLGEFLVYMGRGEEGLAEYRRALELDPASLPIASDYGLAFYFLRRYDESIAELNKVIELDPNFVRTYYYSMYPYLAKGLVGEAVEKLLAGMRAAGESQDDLRAIRKAYETSGIRGVARTRTEQLLRGNPDLITTPLIHFMVLAGDHERALDYLDRAYESRSSVCTTLKGSPMWDNLRDEPRFQALVKKLGFPQ